MAKLHVRRIEHGFSIASILMILLLALILWGIDKTKQIAPVINNDQEQLRQLVIVLNKLQACKWQCGIYPLARKVDCGCTN